MSSKPTQTILLIDNDEDLLIALSTRLDYLGYRCITARTGAQGLDEFAAMDVDLIITDMNMPALDGAGVIEEVRNRCDTPIIVMTGFRKAYAKCLRELPHVQILEKPFHTQDMIDAVESELFFSHAKHAA